MKTVEESHVLKNVGETFFKMITKGQGANGFCPSFNLNTVVGLTMFFTFVGIILGLAFTGENPFVYFQF